MNVQEFQNKLKEVQEIARQHGNALNAAEIRQVFEECDLDKSQLLGVLKYLTCLLYTSPSPRDIS